MSIHSLAKQKQLNGSLGLAVSYDAAKGRYRVRVYTEEDLNEEHVGEGAAAAGDDELPDLDGSGGEAKDASAGAADGAGGRAGEPKSKEPTGQVSQSTSYPVISTRTALTRRPPPLYAQLYMFKPENLRVYHAPGQAPKLDSECDPELWMTEETTAPANLEQLVNSKLKRLDQCLAEKLITAEVGSIDTTNTIKQRTADPTQTPNYNS